MIKIFVKPKANTLVRHETGEPLAEAGEEVERTAYWLGRERDGDVTISAVKAVKPKATEAK